MSQNNIINRYDRDPLVTVYITNYNYGEYISEAIESVLSQKFDNYELLIIDDGSTDNSRKIIEQYSNNDSIRVIYQENKGLNHSINVALNASRGKYIMRLDADDFLDSNALLVMTNELEKDENLALVFPDYYYVDEMGEVIGQERRNDFDEVSILDRPSHGACTLFRKNVLLEVGSYSTDYTCQDNYDIWLKIIGKYDVKNVNLPLFYYRRHGENLTEDQTRILNNRSQIKHDHVNDNELEANALAVVPVRGKQINNSTPVLEELGEKLLIEWTLEAINNVPQIDKTIISTPDSDVKLFISENYDYSIHDRPVDLARENVSLHKTINEITKSYNTDQFDAIAQITPHAPFRPSRSIKEAIDTLQIFPVDFVIGVVPENDKFYAHDGNGLKPISQTQYGEDLRLERERLFRRSGGIKVINLDFIQNQDKWIDPTVGHVVLQKHEAIEIKQKKDMEFAKMFAKSHNLL